MRAINLLCVILALSGTEACQAAALELKCTGEQYYFKDGFGNTALRLEATRIVRIDRALQTFTTNTILGDLTSVLVETDVAYRTSLVYRSKSEVFGSTNVLSEEGGVNRFTGKVVFTYTLYTLNTFQAYISFIGQCEEAKRKF